MQTTRRSQRAGSAAHKSLKEPAGEDSWDDSDDDVAPRTAKAGSARKAARATDGDDAGGAAAAAGPKQRRGGRAAAAAAVDIDSVTLFEVILKHPNALDTAVKEWIQRYKNDRSKAAAELLTVIVRAAGCDEDLTEDDVEGGEVDELAGRLTQIVTEEGGFVLFTQTRAGRTLAGNYCLFWDKVMRGLAAAELLFDGFDLNDRLARLVTALSISLVRTFRHAATLTAAQLVSSWITVSEGLGHSRDLAKAQLDAEEKKAAKGGKGGAANASVLASLRRNVERCHARVEDLRNFRAVTFSGVFSHRFRDVSEDIRCIVIEAIGDWVVSAPAEFLGDSHLKYLAWALSDRAPVVRRQAVEALMRLYADSDHVPRMHDFSGRFKARFCELMFDTDSDVIAAGLRLLALLVQHGIVSHQDVGGAFKLLTLPQADVAAAAAELVTQLLEEQGRESMTATAARLRAAADAAADGAAAAAGKSKSKGGRGSKAKQQPAAAAGDAASVAAAAAAEAAEALLEQPGSLKLAGLLAVMGRMAAGGGSSGGSDTLATPGVGAADEAAAAAVAPLPATSVTRLVEALWDQMGEALGDSHALCALLADAAATELWGRLGCSHLASVLAAAAHTAIHRGGRGAGGGKRGGGRARSKAAGAGAGEVADPEAQQELTVLMMQQLPSLLTQYQAEPLVAAPLLAIIRLLRLELYLLRGAAETYRSLLTQVDGLMQRHASQELLLEGAGALVYASKVGPAALTEVGGQVLGTAASTASAKLAAAAAAVGKLRAMQLADGVTDLRVSPEDAPDALLELMTSARRVHTLLSAGSASLSRDKTLHKTCQSLLKASLEGRELGPEVTSLLLHISNKGLLFQLRALQAAGSGAGDDTASVVAYVQARSAFTKVLEGVLSSGSDEQLVTPEQLLSARWAASGEPRAAGAAAGGGGSQAGAVPVSDELAAQLGVGLFTLQDLAYCLLTDLMFTENGISAGLQQQQEAEDGGDQQHASAAAAAAAIAGPGGFGRAVLSASAWGRVWSYACGVLQREAPEVPEQGAGDDDAVLPGSRAAAALADEEDEDPDLDFDDWDADAAAGRRAARIAARREALAAAAVGLTVLKERAVAGLVRLVGYRCVPEPSHSWLLHRMVGWLAGYGSQAATFTRMLLGHLKSADGPGFVGAAVAGLGLLFEAAQEAHGEPVAGGRGGDVGSWGHVAAVARKLAGLFHGHNLSQDLLGQLVEQGVAWAAEEPVSRAAFPDTCLGPFLSKLSSTEAERQAGALAALLGGDTRHAPGGAAAAAALADALADDEGGQAAAQLEAFLGHLQERAAGKKVTRGVLKTPGKLAAAAAAGSDDEEEDDAHEEEDEQELAEGPGKAAGGKGRGRGAAAAAAAAAGGAGRKRSRIRFAGEAAAGSDDGEEGDEAAAAARPAAKRGRGSPAGRRQQQQQQQQDDIDAEWEAAAGHEDAHTSAPAARGRAPAAASSGWHTKKSPRKAAAGATAAAAQQQQRGRRGRSSQQQSLEATSEDDHQQQQHEDDEEDAVEAPSRQQRGAAARGGRPAAKQQSQSHSQAGGSAVFFSPEDLPTFGRPRSGAAQPRPRRKAGGATSVDVLAADSDVAAGDFDDDGDDHEGDAAAYDDDDEMEQQEQHRLMGGPSQGVLSQGLASLQVVMDDLPDDDGEEVTHEPPPAAGRRAGRRRR